MASRCTAALVAVFMLLFAGPAAAHDEIVATTPMDGERVEAFPDEVRVEFATDVETRSTVTVVDPDGDVTRGLTPRIDGPIVVIPLRLATDPGTYTIQLRVISADGHPVSSTIRFSLTEPAITTGSAATASRAPGETDSSAPHGAPVWPWIAIAVAAVIGGRMLLRSLDKHTAE